MGTRLESAKFMTGLLLSTAVMAGVIADLNYYSPRTLNLGRIKGAVSKRLDDLRLRDVASESTERYAIQYLPFNEENIKLIDGKWRIYNFINVSGHDEVMDVVVNLNLIGTSKVKIDNDPNQVFRISYLTEQRTMALVKRVGKGFEILEMEKIKEIEKVKKTQDKVSSQKDKVASSAPVTNKKGVTFPEDMDLILERAFNPNLSKNIFVGDYVVGNVSIIAGNIQSLEVTIARGLKEERSIMIEFAEVKDGGVFEADVDGEMVSGIITNNGQNAYRVRFASGPMQGAMLNFVTQEEYDRLIEVQRNLPKSARSVFELGSLDKEQESSQVERKGVAEMDSTQLPAQSAASSDQGKVDDQGYQKQAQYDYQEGDLQIESDSAGSRNGDEDYTDEEKEALREETAYGKEFTKGYLDEKQMDEQLKNTGFDFSQSSLTRSLASEEK